jgi:hypothetical protein
VTHDHGEQQHNHGVKPFPDRDARTGQRPDHHHGQVDPKGTCSGWVSGA